MYENILEIFWIQNFYSCKRLLYFINSHHDRSSYLCKINRTEDWSDQDNGIHPVTRKGASGNDVPPQEISNSKISKKDSLNPADLQDCTSQVTSVNLQGRTSRVPSVDLRGRVSRPHTPDWLHVIPLRREGRTLLKWPDYCLEERDKHRTRFPS